MKYYGIDPSLTGTGLCNEYEFHGEAICIKTSSKERTEDRFNHIIKTILSITKGTNGSVNKEIIFGIEGISFMSRGRGADKLTGLHWAIRLALYNQGFKYYEIPPSAVKKFATGKGNAKKEQMLLTAYKNFGIEFQDNNICDGFFIAKITKHLHENDLEGLTKYQQETIKSLQKKFI